VRHRRQDALGIVFDPALDQAETAGFVDDISAIESGAVEAVLIDISEKISRRQRRVRPVEVERDGAAAGDQLDPDLAGARSRTVGVAGCASSGRPDCAPGASAAAGSGGRVLASCAAAGVAKSRVRARRMSMSASSADRRSKRPGSLSYAPRAALCLRGESPAGSAKAFLIVRPPTFAATGSRSP